MLVKLIEKMCLAQAIIRQIDIILLEAKRDKTLTYNRSSDLNVNYAKQLREFFIECKKAEEMTRKEERKITVRRQQVE